MDAEFLARVGKVHQFMVTDNKRDTFTVEKATAKCFLMLCELIARESNGDGCGHCEACTIVNNVKRVLASELRKNIS